jgi:hypothetical protein
MPYDAAKRNKARLSEALLGNLAYLPYGVTEKFVGTQEDVCLLSYVRCITNDIRTRLANAATSQQQILIQEIKY